MEVSESVCGWGRRWWAEGGKIWSASRRSDELLDKSIFIFKRTCGKVDFGWNSGGEVRPFARVEKQV